MRELSIETPAHGRVLVRSAVSPAAVLLGFHGYMENADIQMQRLTSIAGGENWTLVAVQGLHRFYRGRSEEVVSSWMTRQDRELMIADNIEYVRRVVVQLAPADVPLFTIGFSQGVATAFRGGIRGPRAADGIVAVGGDVPPELLEDSSLRFPRVLLARGATDDWYTAAKLNADQSALRLRNVDVTSLVYPGGHEWTTEVAEAAARFIAGAT